MQNIREKYYTTEELCKKLDVCRVTIHNYRQRGLLCPVKIGGKILFPVEQIENIMKGSQNTIKKEI
jgi:predicted site-specific integrase-resolvase